MSATGAVLRGVRWWKAAMEWTTAVPTGSRGYRAGCPAPVRMRLNRHGHPGSCLATEVGAHRRRVSAADPGGRREQADACPEPGPMGAPLRRERLCASHGTARWASRSGRQPCWSEHGRGPSAQRGSPATDYCCPSGCFASCHTLSCSGFATRLRSRGRGGAGRGASRHASCGAAGQPGP